MCNSTGNCQYDKLEQNFEGDSDSDSEVGFSHQTRCKIRPLLSLSVTQQPYHTSRFVWERTGVASDSDRR